MTELVLLALGVALLLSLANLHVGVLAVLFAGFLQDLARKLVSGEPVYLTIVAVALAAACFAGAFFRGAIPPFSRIPDWNRDLKWPSQVFALMVLLQSIATYFYTSSLVLAGIGMAVYLAPFPAFLMGYSFATSPGAVVKFLKVYLGLTTVATAGIFLSWLGVEWDLLRSVGEPLVVFSLETGLPLELPSGFMRSPEIAAWHAASGLCVAVILGAIDRRPGTVWLSALLCIYFMAAVFLTGRRKFLLEILVFLPLFYLFLVRLKVGMARLTAIMGTAVAAGVGTALFGLFTDDTVSRLGEATMRHETSALEDTLARFSNLTFGSFEYIIAENGMLGAGAGSGSQGAQHFGGGMDVVGLSAEGGLGKVLAELGVPGLLLFLWLGVAFLRYLWRALVLVPVRESRTAVLTIGICAFLGANAVVFVGAHQVFGDLFILLVLGLSIGFVMASRRWSLASPAGAPSAAFVPRRPGYARNPR